MSMIYASQVLELLAKANRLSINYDVREEDDYIISFYVNWFTERYGYEKVIISKDNQDKSGSDWNFDTFMDMLDEKLKEQEEKKIKAEKRKELINSLTPEQRELLGL